MTTFGSLISLSILRQSARQNSCRIHAVSRLILWKSRNFLIQREMALRACTAGMSGLPQNKKHELSEFCRGQPPAMTSWLRQNLVHVKFLISRQPRKGGRGCLIFAPPPLSASGISGLSFDSTLLSPILFFCLLPFLCLCFVFFLLPTSPFS